MTNKPTPIMGNFGAKKQLYLHPEQVYGKLALYPCCPDSELFCELCMTKTFTPHMIDKITALGYEIQRTYNPEGKQQYKVK